ncbi:Neuron navigator 3, partial [Bulinus truncatus]
VENINTSLTFLASLGVSVEGVSAKDIKDGNLKSILGLFFSLSRYKQQQKTLQQQKQQQQKQQQRQPGEVQQQQQQQQRVTVPSTAPSGDSNINASSGSGSTQPGSKNLANGGENVSR